MRESSVIVIGGGASGLSAAIAAGRKGVTVTLCERSDRLGRKVLASGNGRCNLTNDILNSALYNPAAERLVRSVFSRFGNDHIRELFRSLGLFLHSEEGRVFPVTNQAASVERALENEIERLGVQVERFFEVSSISEDPRSDRFVVAAKSGKSIRGRRVVIACGGSSYPSLGSDGSGYRLAGAMGHKIIEPVPACVPLVLKDRLCHTLQGQKIRSRVSSIIRGETLASSDGDLLFTKYGLSGTAILDVSESISIAINRDRIKDVAVLVDMAPFISEEVLMEEIKRRRSGRIRPEDLLTGILPNKFGQALVDILSPGRAADIISSIKKRIFKVTGTRGWNEAEFTAGGVALDEIDPADLQSTKKRGIFFVGEMVDVTGKRGGYNLAWAWASGYLAGEAACDA